jgi:hypothetical protein
MQSPDLFGKVTRKGKFFEIGEYPDKNFSITEEEFDRGISSFKPFHNTIEHLPTLFDGKLGETTRIFRDGKTVYAEYQIPKWLDIVTGGEPIKTSAEWDRETKVPVGNSLVLTPRVADAVMMTAINKLAISPSDRIAAFKDYTEKTRQSMAKEGEALPDGRYPISNVQDLHNAIKDYEMGDRDMPAHDWIVKRAKELGAFDDLPEQWKKKANMTSNHKMHVRDFHHRMVDCGAECKGKAIFSSEQLAEFMTPGELKEIQAYHDKSTDGGRNCDHYRTMNSGFGDTAPPRFTEGKDPDMAGEKKPGLLSKIASFLGGEGLIDDDKKKKLEDMDGDGDDDMDDEKKKKDMDDKDGMFSAKFAKMQEVMEAQAAEIKQLREAQFTNSAAAQFSLDCTSLNNLVSTGRMTRAEADKYQEVAKEDPAAFAKILPILAAKRPLAQFNDRPVHRLEPSSGSAAQQLDKLTKEKMKDTGSNDYAATFSAVCRENKELAQQQSVEGRSSLGGPEVM